MASGAVVHATQAWLQSSRHVQVPFAWLEACVEWLQEEAGGAGRLSQQQINQQALDQWLLTDLRDLDHPVLPEGLAQAQKTQLRGTFCVQVDSLLDISQPAYGQLQKWKGTDCANDSVSADTQRPWEARSTRMLLLQVTDGVQSLEAMEYQPIPALSTALRPGVKLQLQGQMVCRLGVLLLGPSNIKVLGGEVEELVDRNNQGRVLCRTLGFPEEEQQQDAEEAPPSCQGNREAENMEVDDQELLASLEAQEVAEERVPRQSAGDSGYGTLSETSTQSLRSTSARSLASSASSRSEASALSSRSGWVQSSRSGMVQGYHHDAEQAEPALAGPSSSGRMVQQETVDDDFPEEDFDDLPLDELDGGILHGDGGTSQSNRGIFGGGLDRAAKTGRREQQAVDGSASRLGSSHPGSTSQRGDTRSSNGVSTGRLAASEHSSHPASPEPPRQSSHRAENYECDFMAEDMDCIPEEIGSHVAQTGRTGGPDQLQTDGGERENATGRRETGGSALKSNCKLSRDVMRDPSCESSCKVPQGQSGAPTTAKNEAPTAPALTLTSPPFTYLCLLDEVLAKPRTRAVDIRVKAFIVTLLGKLSSSGGLWRVCATISDGTGYLDVQLSDEVLAGLLGFSVAKKAAMRRDPARRSELDAGMRRCQEELVDMCCVMTVALEAESGKAVVAKAEPVNEGAHRELELRARARRK